MELMKTRPGRSPQLGVDEDAAGQLTPCRGEHGHVTPSLEMLMKTPKVSRKSAKVTSVLIQFLFDFNLFHIREDANTGMTHLLLS